MTSCKWCERRDIDCPFIARGATHCPLELDCNTCGACGGRWCKRPSGHRAAQLHMDRVLRADADAIAQPAVAEGQEQSLF